MIKLFIMELEVVDSYYLPASQTRTFSTTKTARNHQHYQKRTARSEITTTS
jgi:hypothetical protein